MQTDCPTEDMRDRKMKRNNNDRMRRRMVSRKIRLRKKLPHTRDPEFATPESQEKKKIRTRTEEERTQHKEKQVKHKRRSDEQEDGCVRCRAEEAFGCSGHAQTCTGGSSAAHHFMLLLHLCHFLGVFLVHLL